MLTVLLATGFFNSDDTAFGTPSDVTTPASRTIVLTQAGTSFVAAQSIDPSDMLDYMIDLSAMLTEGEQFSTLSLVILPSAVAQGFTVLSTPPYHPEEIDNSHVRIWVTIDGASRSLPAWSGQGTNCSFELTATTNSTPPRVFQRTASIRVTQR